MQIFFSESHASTGTNAKSTLATPTPVNVIPEFTFTVLGGSTSVFSQPSIVTARTVKLTYLPMAADTDTS